MQSADLGHRNYAAEPGKCDGAAPTLQRRARVGDTLGVIEIGGTTSGGSALRVRGVAEGFEISFDAETGTVTAEKDAIPCEAGDSDEDGVLDCPPPDLCCGDPTRDA